MSPEYLVGSIITPSGPQPFVMYTETGKFDVGNYAKPDEAQQSLSVIQQQRFIQLIAERAGLPFAQVRLGQYHCSECGRWVEATPQQWSLSICMSCSMDRATELHEHYQEQATREAAQAVPVVEEAPIEAPAAPALPDEEPAEEEEPAPVMAPEPPEEVVPEEVVPEETAVEAEMPEEAALEEEVLELEVPEAIVLEDEASEEATPELDVPEDAFIDVALLPDEAVMLEKAIHLAVEAHRGQRDKAGEPYILHPLRMMLALDTPSEKMAAVLHDVVEDTPWTLEGLRRAGFSEEIVEAVACLTKQDDESYEAFIERAAQHPIARRVKRADIEDNMDVRRLDTLTQKDQSRLARYLRAWRRLKAL